MIEVILPYLEKAGAGLLATATVAYPFRKAHGEWLSLKSSILGTQRELTQQRENCLTTLQDQGRTQIELLGQAVEVLGEIRTDMKLSLEHLRNHI